jgi:cytochrome c-type biogenesis protein CcmH/NrfG
MDHEILQTLQSIRVLLYVVVAVAIVSVGLSALRVWLTIKNGIREANEKVFGMVATDYLAEGKLAELVRHCDEQLAKRPNDGLSLWYLGRARFAQKNFDDAKIAFDRLAEIEPSWTESHVEPMLQAIAKEGQSGRELRASSKEM